MRYKVRQTETVEYVLEAANEEEAREFLQKKSMMNGQITIKSMLKVNSILRKGYL